MRAFVLLPLVTLPCFLACAPGPSNDDDAGPVSCDALTNVSDGPSEDSVEAGATTLVCYYPQPSEGYCRKITNAAQIADFYNGGNDKGAIGCADAVVLSDAECPGANRVGTCTNTSLEAERVYYQCSKFLSESENCTALEGAYVAE